MLPLQLTYDCLFHAVNLGYICLIINQMKLLIADDLVFKLLEGVIISMKFGTNYSCHLSIIHDKNIQKLSQAVIIIIKLSYWEWQSSVSSSWLFIELIISAVLCHSLLDIHDFEDFVINRHDLFRGLHMHKYIKLSVQKKCYQLPILYYKLNYITNICLLRPKINKLTLCLLAYLTDWLVKI